jgi:hypothetical protein
MQTKQAANREEAPFVLALALVLVAASLAFCQRHGWLLLYGDAVAHLHIARRILDSRHPGLMQLGSVWLPLPHLLLVPFVWRTDWWQSGLAGAWPSMASYVAACAGMYRLARRWMEPIWAVLAFFALALNPGFLYMSVTAMTEPLFLALYIWSVVWLLDFECATSQQTWATARAALWKLTAVLIAAVFARYDGWILGALIWLIAACLALRRRLGREQSLRVPMLVCTLLLAAAPAAWMFYNWRLFGDPLDFLRGPYSAQAIAARTTPPGAPHYPGWHNLHIAWLYYLKAATLGAFARHTEHLGLLLACAGTALALWRTQASKRAAALLLWMPLPFYAYSIAYSAVPVFFPQWVPGAYYNTRYGMELLPAFALFPVLAAAAAAGWRPNWRVPALWIALACIVANSVFLMRATPLVLQEAKANASTRVPFEKAIAKSLLFLPPQATVLMYTSEHVGALEDIGFPLRQTLNEGDDGQWTQALRDPAASADVVVAIAGDPVAQAVAQRPAGLQLMDILCTTGQPCARIYRSSEHATQEKN